MGEEYRDALGAAQRRIEQLEGELATARGERAEAAKRRGPSPLVWIAAGLVAVMVMGAGAGATVYARRRHAPDPVSVTAMQSGAGWLVTFHLPADVSNVSYRVRGEREYTDLGTMPWATGADGHAMPLLTTTIPFEQAREPTTIELRYTRADGTRIGPAIVSFSPMKEDVASTKAILTMMGAWIDVKPNGDGATIYFTTLLVYRHAFQTIEYGVDSEEPGTRLSFSPSDRPGVDANDPLMVKIGRVPKFVSVRLTYRDGTKSPIKNFYPSSGSDVFDGRK